jgi:hypothetical protein
MPRSSLIPGDSGKRSRSIVSRRGGGSGRKAGWQYGPLSA